MEYFELIGRIVPYFIFICKELKSTNQETRDIICSVLAANFLHEVSEEKRKVFFKKYEELNN